MQFKKHNLKGLGFVEYLSTAAALLGSGSGSAGSGAPGAAPANNVNNTVSPNINVSPQISPVFQQQFQPQNSAATAGTQQGAPAISSGTDSNGFVPAPSGLSTPLTMPQVPQIPSAPIDWNKYLLWGGAALAGIIALKLVLNKKRAAPRRRKAVKTKVK